MDTGLRFDVGSIRAAIDTPDGFRRVYMRLAKADHPYRYFNRDGTKRIEVITTDELFAPKSANTAKGLPIFNGHPMGRVDSSSMPAPQGAMGDRLFRERTDSGDFLGVVSTLWTDEAKALSEKNPGVSPGYRVKVNRDSKGQGFGGDTTPRFLQSDRVYNHLASGVVPRGGAEVAGLFQGLRFDSADESDIWVAQHDDCYECDLTPNFEDFVLSYRGDGGKVSAIDLRTPVDMTRQQLPAEPVQPPVSHEDAGDCQCEKDTEKKKAADKFPENLKPRRDTMASLTIGGATWDNLPDSLVTAVNPLLERTDSSSDIAELSAEKDLLSARVDALEAERNGLQEKVTELSARVDSEDDDENNRFTAEQLLEAGYEIAGEILSLRTDAEKLKSLGLNVGDGKFNLDSLEEVAANGEFIKRGVVEYAFGEERAAEQDEQRLDGYYELASEALERACQERANEERPRADAQQQRPGMQMLGRHLQRRDGMGRKGRKPAYMKQQEEDLKRQNAIFDGKPA